MAVVAGGLDALFVADAVPAAAFCSAIRRATTAGTRLLDKVEAVVALVRTVDLAAASLIEGIFTLWGAGLPEAVRAAIVRFCIGIEEAVFACSCLAF